MFCFQPKIPLCSAAPTSPIAFLILCPGARNTVHLHVSLPTLLGRVVLSLSSCFSSGVLGFKSRRAAKTGVLLVTLSSAFRIQIHLLSVLLSFCLIKVSLTSSFQELSDFNPFFLDNVGVYPPVLFVCKRSFSCPICFSSCIKISPNLHKRNAAFHCYLPAILGFLPISTLSTYSKFLPFFGFSLIKTHSLQFFVSVTRLHGMDNQVYCCYLESISRCAFIIQLCWL